jgi:rSAM/selenodomain-associated transferase 1
MSVRLVIFMKTPHPGEVKTRLIPLLGVEGAARVQRALAWRTLAAAADAGLGAPELWVTPDFHHDFFATCIERFGVRLHRQCDGDLGARLHHALSHVPGQAALVLGTDCPGLDGARLAAAAAALDAGHDAVFHPVEDGGYALVGVRASDPRLFAGVEWSSAQVMAQTRARVAALGWRAVEGDTLWDVDRPADFLRLVREEGFPPLHLDPPYLDPSHLDPSLHDPHAHHGAAA